MSLVAYMQEPEKRSKAAATIRVIRQDYQQCLRWNHYFAEQEQDLLIETHQAWHQESSRPDKRHATHQNREPCSLVSHSLVEAGQLAAQQSMQSICSKAGLLLNSENKRDQRLGEL